MKPIYDANRGQFVLQIMSKDGWQDYKSLKSQADLDAARRHAECCKGAGDRLGTFRVVHMFMGTNVLVDVRHDFS